MMTAIKHQRLIVPLVALTGGSVIAIAVAIHEGITPGAFSEVATVVYSGMLLGASGDDTDLGSVLGHRADERQRIIVWRASNLAMIVTLVAILITAVVAALAGSPVWPYQALAVILSVSFFVGLRVHGADQVEDS